MAAPTTTNLLADYQDRAAATVSPEDESNVYSYEYLIPMIVGEVGELFGQKAKALWHGWASDRLEEELVAEYGDICWGTAILLRRHGVTELEPQSTPSWTLGIDPWHLLLHRSHTLYQAYTEDRDDEVVRTAGRLWQYLEDQCETITGLSFEKVLDYNSQKLASRAERNVLRGSGDHR